MLKGSLRSNIVLAGYAFFLHEVLTIVTLVFVALGIIFSTIGYRTNKLVRNIASLVVFGSYWLTYGRVIDPEIGLNFLTSILVLKILERETKRDQYMIFFGLLLLISSGALFEKTLSYVLFFSGSFLVLIYDFYRQLKLEFKIRHFALSLMWILPLTFMMFFFIPRMMNPLPFKQKTMDKGEIGYSPDVIISDVESLRENNQTVFQALVSSRIDQRRLYWRSNTLSFNDGWNWRVMLQDRDEEKLSSTIQKSDSKIHQTIRLFITPSYFIGLDTPLQISYEDRRFQTGKGTRTLAQNKWKWVPRYEVTSTLSEPITFEGDEKKYLQLPFSREEKKYLKELFPVSSSQDLESSMKSFFNRKDFIYTLSPGKINNFKEFLKFKRGYCSHYASFTALVYRAHGIPARLVSGFMGGKYNHYSNFYSVTQNDSHVWVEIRKENSWVRIDPTEWIAPERVELGGNDFIQNIYAKSNRKNSFFSVPTFINNFRLWFGQWDFMFYQWIDSMDYYAQETLIAKLRIKRRWLMLLVITITLVFVGLYLVSSKKRQRAQNFREHDILWKLFLKKMEKKGLRLSKSSIFRFSDKTNEEASLSKDEREILQSLILFSFSHKAEPFGKIKKKIRGLKS